MAGPTPVSALIHAATMVTAGVYLVARLHGVYADAAAASMVVAWIGVLTAFFAATIAVVQTDIKKVLAYSTISQLGFMFLALGVGAYGVAVFHLATHAFFKACLFLGAGSVIHALGGEQDIRRMGDLARRIPVTFGTFAVATAAIAGLPPLAGFWSKDEILWFALASGSGGSVLLWALGTTTALLTAFYMFRLLWLVFLSPARLDAHAAAHVHESPAAMTVPLVALAGLSIVGGYIPIPAYLAGVLPAAATRADLHALHGPLLGLAVAIALAGLALAWWLYRDGLVRAGAIAARWPALHRLLVGKYRIDEAYHAVLARPLEAVSARVFLAFGDRTLIDGSLHGIAALARGGARGLSRLQAGRISGYLLMAAIGLAGSLAWILVDG
jgi:NADH-quinone oxidoreductase subunit L